MFVDPVKQGLPKIFLHGDNHPQLLDPNQHHQAVLIYPGLFLTLVGFGKKYSLQFISYSLQCECSYEYAIDTFSEHKLVLHMKVAKFKLKMKVDSFGMRFHKGRVNILQKRLKSPACEL